MYVVNPEEIDVSKLYLCNGVIANWLIYEKHFSPFGQNENKTGWYFAKTEKLDEALKELPMYYRVMKIFDNF